ncbi:MAG: Glycine cleavage system H protein [Candidatus Anoxychlamydiales bacterium]|nr:Glycine cleavage system H protein [Candidatus Anoxychlamydiales bacterium]
MKFSNTHEWVEINNDIATVGVTNFGRMHLGDVANIKLPTKDKEVKANEAVCVLESNKAAVDIHSPMSGKIIEINENLNTNLKDLNTSPEEKGWLFKVKISDPNEEKALMSLDEYEKKVSSD